MKPTGPVLKKVGENCQDPAECATGICMKADLNASSGQCRDKCTGPGDCGLGFKCVSQGEGYQGCLPGKESIPSGGLCKFDEQCAGGKCILAGDDGNVCSQSCTVGDSESCPCGMICQNTTKGPACFPAKPNGCLGGGQSCADNSECASSVCADGACREACDIVYGRDKCPDGQGCLRLSAVTTDGYCTTKGTVAERNFCLADDLCVTLFCDVDISKNNETRCGLPCDPGANTCVEPQSCNKLNDKVGMCFTPSDNNNNSGGGAADVSGDASGALVLQPVGGSGGASSSGCSAGAGGTGGATWPLWAALALLMWFRRYSAPRSSNGAP